MDGAERRKNGILGKLKTLGQLETYQKWSSGEIEVANQDNKGKLQVEQVANQEATRIDMENLEKMNLKLTRGMKLNSADKAYLLGLEQSKRPPVDILARSLLANPQNFAE